MKLYEFYDWRKRLRIHKTHFRLSPVPSCLFFPCETMHFPYYTIYNSLSDVVLCLCIRCVLSGSSSRRDGCWNWITTYTIRTAQNFILLRCFVFISCKIFVFHQNSWKLSSLVMFGRSLVHSAGVSVFVFHQPLTLASKQFEEFPTSLSALNFQLNKKLMNLKWLRV